MDVPVLADKQRLIYISSVGTVDAVQKTHQEGCKIGRYGDRESGNLVLSMQFDDHE